MGFEMLDRFFQVLETRNRVPADQLLVTLGMNKLNVKYEVEGRPTIFRVHYDGLGLIREMVLNPFSNVRIPYAELPKGAYSETQKQEVIDLLRNDERIRNRAEIMMSINSCLEVLLRGAPDEFYNAGPIIRLQVDGHGFPTAIKYVDNGHPFNGKLKELAEFGAVGQKG